MVRSLDGDLGQKSWWKDKHEKSWQKCRYLLPHSLPLLSFILSLKWISVFAIFVSTDTRTQINMFREREARSERNISLCLRRNWESAVEAYCFQISNNINYFKYIFIEHLLCARHCKRYFICNPLFKPQEAYYNSHFTHWVTMAQRD